VIQIQSITIREFRGIREVMLQPDGRNFVISGPNGSGKSGVVDAIQFGLTGDISRLSGKGTAGLSVQRHGPHVDKRDDPEAAEVSVTLFVPDTGKTAVLTRNVKDGKTFTLTPEDPKIRAVMEEVALHPELTLSRREIIKYILVEAGERSKEIQALLKLDDVGQIRSILQTAKNKVSSAHSTAQRDLTNSEDAFRRHLDIKKISKEDVLAAINPRRNALGLSPLDDMTAETALNAGVLESGSQPAFNKQSALRDVSALAEAKKGLPTLAKIEVSAILKDIAVLEDDPALLQALTRRAFVERGLSLVDGPYCPLCDTAWDDAQQLQDHLRAKLTKSNEAEVLQQRVIRNAAEIATQARKLISMISLVIQLAKADGPLGLADDLVAWSERLAGLTTRLSAVEDIIGNKGSFETGWVGEPSGLAESLSILSHSLKAKPDQTATIAAQTFLTLAQDRLKSVRAARRAEKQAAEAELRGQEMYKAYCDAMEEQLGSLYAAVEGDFSTYYSEINADDEGAFKARLEPSEGKLDLEVAFYDKGMFPPGAYHSEGHQDGMGVCLYLALMKRLLASRFRFAVLDDVVMSVDQGHRKQFCRLLKSRFPDTQFIITTHDKVWAKQMQTEQLVDSNGGIVFHSWSVQTGPIFQELQDVWAKIDIDLAKNDVNAAAARLRRHLEYVAADLADNFGAKPVFRGDFSYDLGDLLPAVIGRHAEVLKLAAKSAQHWKDEDAKKRVEVLKNARAEAMDKYGGENWVVNKAVHYNEWENFSKAEFRSVVEAFKSLLQQFRCAKAGCESWLYVSPRKGDPEALRCRCGGTNLNLKDK